MEEPPLDPDISVFYKFRHCNSGASVSYEEVGPWLYRTPVKDVLFTMFSSMLDSDELQHFHILDLATRLFKLMLQEHEIDQKLYPGMRNSKTFCDSVLKEWKASFLIR